MTREEIQALPTTALKSIVAFTNADGHYHNEVVWAKATLQARDVDFSDCLPPRGVGRA